MLVQKLSEMNREIELRIPYLNKGGCAVYAALVAAALQRKGHTVRVRVWGYSDSDVRKAVEQVMENHGTLRHVHISEWRSGFNHVVPQVLVDGTWWTFDSANMLADEHHMGWKDNTLKLQPGALTVPEASALAGSKGWNHMFNRQHIPLLARIIQQHMKKIPVA